MSNEFAHDNTADVAVTHLTRAHTDPLFAALWSSDIGVCLVAPTPSVTPSATKSATTSVTTSATASSAASATIVAANDACSQQSGQPNRLLHGASLETLLISLNIPPTATASESALPTAPPSESEDDDDPYALDELDDFDQLALFDEDLFDETVSGTPSVSGTLTNAPTNTSLQANADAPAAPEGTPGHYHPLAEHDIARTINALAQNPSQHWRGQVRHHDGRLLAVKVSFSATTAAAPLITVMLQLEPPQPHSDTRSDATTYAGHSDTDYSDADYSDTGYSDTDYSDAATPSAPSPNTPSPNAPSPNNHVPSAYTHALCHFLRHSHLPLGHTSNTNQHLVEVLADSLEHTPVHLHHAALYLLSQPQNIFADNAPNQHDSSAKNHTAKNPAIKSSEDIHWTVWHWTVWTTTKTQLQTQENYGEYTLDTATVRNHLQHTHTLQVERPREGQERWYVPLLHSADDTTCWGMLVLNTELVTAEPRVWHDLLEALASYLAKMLETQHLHRTFEVRLAAKTNELDLKDEQLAYLHSLIDSTSDFVCLMDAQGNIDYVNPAGQQLVGDSDDTNVPLSASVFVTINAKNTLAAHFAEALQTGSWHGETNFTHADGRSFPVSQVLTPLHNQRGELAGFGTIARDISGHKALEHALRSSESKMRALLEAIPDLIFVFDKQGRYLDVAGRSDGVSLAAEDLVGYSLFDVLPDDLANRLFAAIHEVLVNDRMQRLEYQIGSDTVSEAQLVKMSEGRVLMVVRDITTRKRTEQNLRVFQSLVEAAADGIVLIDDSGTIRYSNPAYDTLVGVADPCKQHITQMLSRSGKQTFEQAIEAMLQTGSWQGNIEHQHSSGDVLTTYMSSFAIRDDKDTFTQAGAIVRDISREYQAERQLQAYKQLLESLLEHLPAGVCVIRYQDDSYLLVNHSFAKQAGYTPADMIGKQQIDMFDAEVVSVWHQRNQHIATSRQMISFEEARHDEQGKLRYYLTSEFPLIDADNEVYAIGVVTSDISNIKQAEHALRQRNDLLTLLHGLSRNLNSAKTYSDMLSSVCERLTKLNIMAANLFIIDLDEHDNPLYSTKMAAWHKDGGVHGQPIGTRLYLPDYPHVQTTLEHPEATNIKHFRDLDEATQTRWRKSGIGTLAVLPIAPTGLWLGQVIMYWSDEHTFTDSNTDSKLTDSNTDGEFTDGEFTDGEFTDGERELLDTLPDILAPVVANRHLLTSLEHTVFERTHELQESQALLQGFMSHTPAVMWVKDLDSKFIMANDNLAQMYGVDAANIRGKSDYDLYAPEVAREFARIEHEIATSKQARILEEDIPLADGMHYWITTKFPILDARGMPQAVGGFSFDITDAKHAEADLQASREQLARAETELNITKRIQELLLPSEHELEAIAELDIAGVMQPAEQVGGDYFDVLSHESGVMLSIGDVTDHGLESGLLMLMTQTAVRTLLTAGIHDSSDFFEILNRALFDNLERMKADKSLTLLRLDYYGSDPTTPHNTNSHNTNSHNTNSHNANSHNATPHNVRISGQHEHLIVVGAHGQVTRIDTLALGMPLGLERTVRRYVAEKQVMLEPGGGVVLYTDGITEAENAQREQYGLNRLCDIISQYWTHSPEQLCQTILQDVSAHIDGHTIYDDITLLVAKRQETLPQENTSKTTPAR